MRLYKCVVVALAMAFGSACQAAVSALIPTKDFARLATYEQLRLSPDGQHLAVSARGSDGHYSLLILKMPEKKAVSVLRFNGEASVGDIAWVSNQRIVVSIAQQDGTADAPRLTGELYGMNLDGSGKGYLFGYRGAHSSGTRIQAGNEAVSGFAKLVDPLVLEPDNALVMMTTNTESTANGRHFSPNYTRLYRMNVYSGKLKEVASSPIRTPTSYYADNKGQARLVYGHGEDSAELQSFWKNDDHDWQPVLIPGGVPRPLSLTEDGKRAFFSVEKTATQRCLVELAIPATGVAVSKELLCKPLNEMARFYFTADGAPYAYQGVEDDGLVLIGAAPLEARVLASLQTQFKDQKVELLSRSRDSHRLLFVVYSDHYAGEYFLYDDDTKQAAFLDSNRLWLVPDQMADVRKVDYLTRDGLTIHAYLTLPPGRPAQNLPMVVLPHGGPIGVRNRWRWDADAQFLASRGYAVLQMNFRGSGGYGAQFEHKGYGEWGGKIIDDITDGARWAVTKGYADPQRLCIFGASYGGYAALMSAVREPNLYRCAVGYSGVYDLNLLVDDSDVVNRNSGRLFLQESMGKTQEARALQSPIHYLDKLKAAVMIVHGERDIRAPYSQAKALRAALKDRNKPFEWLVKSDEGHGFSNEDNRTELYDKLAAFLDRNIGTVH